MSVYRTGPEAYRQTLHQVLARSCTHTVRGLRMSHEIIGHSFTVQQADTCLLDIPSRKMNRAYAFCESLWDMCPTLDPDILKPFNPHIGRYIDDQSDKTKVAWGYGPVVCKELLRCMDILAAETFSRRAIFSMPPNDDGDGTPPCLTTMQFFVRQNKLHAVTTMRSNDVWLGLPLDMFQFTLMQHTLATGLGLTVGSYTHSVGSMHIYEENCESAIAVARSKPYGNEWSHYPNLTPKAFEDVKSQQLLVDLYRVSRGERANTSSGFYPMLKYMEEYLAKKKGN